MKPEQAESKDMKRFALIIALGAFVLVGFFVAQSLIYEVPNFFDPCHTFGYEHPLLPSSQCPRSGGTSETRLGAITRLTMVQGGAFLSVLLGVIGIYRSWSLFSIIGITYLSYLSFLPSGILALFTVPSALLILIARITAGIKS